VFFVFLIGMARTFFISLNDISFSFWVPTSQGTM